MQKKGFTLIELLIVIGILAILATTAVLILNPAELLAQARDSQRLNDLSGMKSSIALYLTTANSPSVINNGPAAVFNCTTDDGVTAPVTTRPAGNPFSAACNVTTTIAVDGNGWVTINFAALTGGTPISSLPIDPTNDANHFYGYAATSTNNVFELDTVLESAKYSPLMAKDGGDKAAYYEIGTAPLLAL